MQHKTSYFRLIFYDDDNKLFGVSGIVISDDSFIERTNKLQKKGLNVWISATEPVKDKSKVLSVQEIVLLFQGRYTYDPDLKW